MVSVNTIQSGTVFAWFMLVMVVRRIVMLIIAGIAGYNRPFPADRVPEDKILKRGQVAPPTASGIVYGNFSTDVRINKTINNDSENDTYFLILLLATAVFSDNSNGNGNCTRTIVYGVIYSFFRICYAVVYIRALQPWRTIAFYFGVACTLACNLDLVITLSRRSN